MCTWAARWSSSTRPAFDFSLCRRGRGYPLETRLLRHPGPCPAAQAAVPRLPRWGLTINGATQAADPLTPQGPGVVVRCSICDGLTVSDSECGEGVVVVVEVAAGVGDVGASGQAQGADRQVAEGGQCSGCGAGAQLGGVFAEGDVADPMQTIFHDPVTSFVVVELCRAGQVGGQAGDSVHDLLSGPDAVEVAGVAAEPEGLYRTGEQALVG